ncbi:hypothetical protein [Xanthomonas vasicola]|uniref:Uncharacterized protein n=1 Tax=Xanthomonas vasicola pv. vasculorum NCPPB 890 TaxID=1184265 RepID=A0A836ZUL7_XANVA|nr:hypothetical protein [Xanthomonas vasicola]MBV6747259.1 hypothetical protein [Xanthomonas vasicola pv. vasculorum NCPPB 890]MBV6892671.1 hypothetical protein [Xanthomonas vasicola pv. vasculorum]MDO6948405.1 hypothetical protein [Xanthomonas vasicola]MDO6960420.1 hypothetical protein [Xanthomonas vasicola]
MPTIPKITFSIGYSPAYEREREALLAATHVLFPHLPQERIAFDDEASGRGHVVYAGIGGERHVLGTSAKGKGDGSMFHQLAAMKRQLFEYENMAQIDPAGILRTSGEVFVVLHKDKPDQMAAVLDRLIDDIERSEFAAQFSATLRRMRSQIDLGAHA